MKETDNEITAQIFLKAYFGDNVVCKYDCYKDGQFEGARWYGDLDEILEMYADIKSSGNLVQIKNPRSGGFTIIDKDRGRIIVTTPREIVGIRKISKLKPQ